MNGRLFKVIGLMAMAALLYPGCSSSDFEWWFEDSLVKIFDDSLSPASRTERQPVVSLARNGHGSLQLALRPLKPVSGFSIRIETAKESPVQLELRRVGTVSVKRNTPESPAEEWVRQAPGEFPDPLFDSLPAKLDPGKTSVFWITAFVPGEANPGNYPARVLVQANGREEAFPFALEVMKAVVPTAQRLRVSNWFTFDREHLGRHFNLSNEESFWTLVSSIARVMAAHRQTAILTPVGDLVKVGWEKGRYQFNFSEFDRWVEAFRAGGVIGTIEGGHLLTRASGYFSPVVVPAWVLEKGKLVKANLAPENPVAERYLREFLRALYAHLEERGWTKDYIQHLHDEPHGEEIAIYERYSALVKAELPGILTIDAVDLAHNNGFLERTLDIWVPVLSSFDDRLDVLDQHRRAGGINWLYTCIVPQGKYANRFIDFSLLKVRLLHWFNFRYGFAGYLHWGGNYWTEDPFGDVEPVINDGKTLLPPGDNALVYPDPKNLSILSSIRLEAMMEGIEDYELLAALAESDPAKAAEIAQAAIAGMTDYVRDPAQFRSIQRKLLEAAAQ